MHSHLHRTSLFSTTTTKSSATVVGSQQSTYLRVTCCTCTFWSFFATSSSLLPPPLCRSCLRAGAVEPPRPHPPAADLLPHAPPSSRPRPSCSVQAARTCKKRPGTHQATLKVHYSSSPLILHFCSLNLPISTTTPHPFNTTIPLPAHPRPRPPQAKLQPSRTRVKRRLCLSSQETQLDDSRYQASPVFGVVYTPRRRCITVCRHQAPTQLALFVRSLCPDRPVIRLCVASLPLPSPLPPVALGTHALYARRLESHPSSD